MKEQIVDVHPLLLFSTCASDAVASTFADVCVVVVVSNLFVLFCFDFDDFNFTVT